MLIRNNSHWSLIKSIVHEYKRRYRKAQKGLYQLFMTAPVVAPPNNQPNNQSEDNSTQSKKLGVSFYGCVFLLISQCVTVISSFLVTFSQNGSEPFSSTQLWSYMSLLTSSLISWIEFHDKNPVNEKVKILSYFFLVTFIICFIVLGVGLTNPTITSNRIFITMVLILSISIPARQSFEIAYKYFYYKNKPNS